MQQPLSTVTMKFSLATAVLASVSFVSAAVVWDGRFNDYSTAADFDKWSWSNQVGTYQTYIYGNQNVSNVMSVPRPSI